MTHPDPLRDVLSRLYLFWPYPPCYSTHCTSACVCVCPMCVCCGKGLEIKVENVSRFSDNRLNENSMGLVSSPLSQCLFFRGFTITAAISRKFFFYRGHLQSTVSLVRSAERDRKKNGRSGSRWGKQHGLSRHRTSAGRRAVSMLVLRDCSTPNLV